MSKRRHATDGETIEDTPNATGSDSPTKKARTETNAAARRTLFVRSLPAVATTEALTELFSAEYPLKHATVVLDTETKQSKGYGFVTFADAEDAQKAQEHFNGQAFMGRKMKIEIAQPRSRDIGKAAGLDGRVKSKVSEEAAAIKKARQEQMTESKKPPKLIIRNLPWSVKSPEELAKLFQKFGKVKHSTLPKIKDNTQAGFGFVVMRGRKNAEKAMASMNGTLVDGRTVAVDWAVEKEQWEKQNQNTAGDAPSEGDVVAGNTSTEKAEATGTVDDDVANFMKNFGDQLESEDEDDNDKLEESDVSGLEDEEIEDDDGGATLEWEDENDLESEKEIEEEQPQKTLITDNSTTLFVRNLPFTCLDPDLKEHFDQFGPVRYARVVMDRSTGRPKGTGFVCFYSVEDAHSCYRDAPRNQPTGANATQLKHSVLQAEDLDKSGLYTIDGRVLQIARAVDKDSATKLTENGTAARTDRDKDKRKLYLLSEGTVASGTPLYESLAPSEVKMREDSATQRKKLIQNNPTLHLSLTRLSIRNLPRNVNSKDLKALAREAVVGFAKDVKAGARAQLSKEEEARGGEEMREAEKQRKVKGKGIVRQAKIVFEGREGAKIAEDSGAGRSRGYGFVEYSSHRWALMGLRWLNGHALTNGSGKKQRLIVEFAIENAQVVQRRKEREEKARIRSTEVLEARKRGELPEKEKKELKKDQVMKKTRKGMVGKKGRPQEKPARSFDKVAIEAPKPANGKRKREFEEERGRKKSKAKLQTENKGGKGYKSNSERATGDDEKLAKKSQIIQRKRVMRKQRRGGK